MWNRFQRTLRVLDAMRIGRNDPCPCGSGRKYKHCHGAEAAIPPAELERRSRDRLVRALLEFSRHSRFAGELQRAILRFWGPELASMPVDEALAAMSPEWAVPAFWEWFLYDFRLGDGRTVVDHFLAKHPATLSADERAYAEQLRLSSLSLYQIEDVRSDEGFMLRDLFRGGTFRVRERLATRSLVRWDVLATRLVDSGSEKIITGGLIPFRVQDRDPLLRSLKQRYARYRKAHAGAAPEDFLKDTAEFFNHYVQEILALPPPQLITSEQDAVLFCRSHYRVADREAVMTALRQIPELEETEPGSFDWHETVEGRLRSLGSIDLKDDELELWCMSRERMARGKALLERHAGTYLTHRGDTVQDPWVAASVAGPPQESRSIPPEIEAAVYQAQLDDHYRRWLDESVPMLGGHTPRQAVATAWGRKAVAELLRGIENHEERYRLERGFGYDATWLWRELGLDPSQ